jgi:hypothetical protein
MPHTIINILEATSFDAFAEHASASIEKLFDMLEKELAEVLKKAVERENRPPSPIGRVF